VNNRRNFDTLAPGFRLRINNSDLPTAARADLIAVSVTEDVEATGMFSFTLTSWDGAQTKVKWIDHELFKEGNSVEVLMGYGNNLKTLFRGEITGLEPEFDREMAPTLTVRGYDRRHRLMRKRKTRSYLNMKDSDIASQIAGDAGLTPEVEDTGVTLEYVLQHNQTDLEFLEARAQRNGYEMTVFDRTLYFRPRGNDESEVLTLNRAVELLAFYPRLTTVGQVQELFVRGWNPKEKKEFVARSGTGDESSLMSGSASGPDAARRSFGETGSIFVDSPMLSQAEADHMARGWFGEMALHYIVGHGTCIGQPALRAGSVVKIEGLGKRFSGRYYVTSTEHSYKPKVGYHTTFTVRRNAT
jgi:phage protein D